MKLCAVESKIIAAYGWQPYDAKHQTLRDPRARVLPEKLGLLVIEFVNGDTWNYAGVPERVFAGLLGAESKGGYFRRFVRGRYEESRADELQAG